MKILEVNQAMLPELSELKFKRKQLNLTQIQLFELSGVSQSLIAKIESGKTIPSYDNAKKLFDSLEKISEAHGLTAQAIMKKPVVFVHLIDSVQKTIRLMQKHGFSQLPVLDGDKISGAVSEKGILEHLQKNPGQVASETPIKLVLENAFPQVPEDTPLRTLASVLEYAPAVLVVKNGKTEGIISKSDFLKTVADKKITKHHRLI